MREILIAGGSMSPTLEVGDVVQVVDGLRIRVGDVIAFQGDPDIICHRAVLVVPGWSVCWIVHLGDAGGRHYGTVLRRNVLGRVVARKRRGVVTPVARAVPNRTSMAHALTWLAARVLRR